MKTILINTIAAFVLLLICNISFGQQVGIGLNNPTHTLHIKGQNPITYEPLRVEDLRRFQTNDTSLLITDQTTGGIRYIPISDLNNLIGGGSSDTDIDSMFYQNDTLYLFEDLTTLKAYIPTNRDTLYFIIRDSLISDSNFIKLIRNDNDSVVGNEYNTSFVRNGGRLQLTDGGGTFSVPLPDSSSTNELQTIAVTSPNSSTDVTYTLTPTGNTTNANDGDWNVNATGTSLSAHFNTNTVNTGNNSVAVGSFIYSNSNDVYVQGSGDSLINSNFIMTLGTGNVIKNATRGLVIGVDNKMGLGVTNCDDGFIVGNFNEIDGTSTVIYGNRNIASNSTSRNFIFGENDTVTGIGSYTFTFGNDNKHLATSSNIIGTGIVSNSVHETVFGRYNAIDPSASTFWNTNDKLFTVANGFNTSSRSDAFVVLKNGNTFTNGNQLITSDKRHKTNIKRLESSSKKLLDIKGYTYNWKDTIIKSKEEQVGFISQEVERVYPQLILEINGIKALNYQGLIPVVVEATNEHTQTILKQNKRIEDLENQIKELKLLILEKK